MFWPLSVFRNAVETTALLVLIDYLTNEILIIGRITFFNQILDGTEDFWPRFCRNLVRKWN